jgi:hypothetical protein
MVSISMQLKWSLLWDTNKNTMKQKTESRWQIFFAIVGFSIFGGLLLIAAGMCDK